jgi:alpha-glucosidase
VWDSLAFQPWFTATAANVGYAYWSHDIGGHIPGAVEPELYTRWVQFGAFSPILRTHTTKNPDTERRIWAYPEPYADLMKQTFQMRYAMQPYIYTEARRTYDTGVAFVRPLYYEWPEAAEAYEARGEYMFGDAMVAAPVTTPVDAATQMAAVTLWVPPGEWFEWSTGKHLHGPAKIEARYSIDQVPLLVRAGAIVPMQPPMQYTGEKPVDPLIVNVMPLVDGQRSTYTLYDDTSKGEAYKDGVCTWTELKASRTGDTVTVDVEPVRGAFAGMLERRAYEVRLPGDWPPESVVANSVPLSYEPAAGKVGWRFEGNTLTTVVTLPQSSVHVRMRLTVRRRAGLEAKAAELDGFAAAMSRYRAAYDDMNRVGRDIWSPDALIEAWQTGDRITYKPQTAEAEMDAFARRSQVAMKSVADLIGAQPAASAKEPAEAAQGRVMLRRASAALQDLPAR